MKVRLRQRKGTEHKGEGALGEWGIRKEATAARRKDSSRAVSTKSSFGKWDVSQNMNKNEKAIKSGLPFVVCEGEVETALPRVIG